ncbi:unnamed protein product [Clavelina lepadiformis]|uniref:Uncharacterized protein n=1 Tax=Clavelina lepadiformis TaxID=159417 RepID=A0ABP0G5Z4_CLALP
MSRLCFSLLQSRRRAPFFKNPVTQYYKNNRIDIAPTSPGYRRRRPISSPSSLIRIPIRFWRLHLPSKRNCYHVSFPFLSSNASSALSRSHKTSLSKSNRVCLYIEAAKNRHRMASNNHLSSTLYWHHRRIAETVAKRTNERANEHAVFDHDFTSNSGSSLRAPTSDRVKERREAATMNNTDCCNRTKTCVSIAVKKAQFTHKIYTYTIQG